MPISRTCSLCLSKDRLGVVLVASFGNRFHHIHQRIDVLHLLAPSTNEPGFAIDVHCVVGTKPTWRRIGSSKVVSDDKLPPPLPMLEVTIAPLDSVMTMVIESWRCR